MKADKELEVDPIDPEQLNRPSRDLFSEAHLALVNRWRDKCAKHRICRRIKLSQKLQTRVLLLPSTFGPTGSVRLIEPDGLEGEYACLSYCWGASEQNAKTTKDKISQYDLGIQISNLPKTIVDTIQLCCSLGFRYLWVDALCIIQDDEKDWLREASKMCDIFSKSALTIATPVCGDSSESFVEKRRLGLGETSPTATIIYRGEGSGMQGSICLRLPKILTSYEKGPWFLDNTWYGLAAMHKSRHSWLGRAWTLQEWMLSPRVLHIHEMTLWDCLGGYGNEIDRRFIGHIRLDRYRYSRPLSPKSAIPWQVIVEEFTSRAITKAEDRLPALAGLAKQYSENTGYKYLAGLWLEELPLTLLWSVNSPAGSSYARDKLYGDGAPSWSWASLTGPVYFHCVQRKHEVDIKVSQCGPVESQPQDPTTILSTVNLNTIELKGSICRVTTLIKDSRGRYLYLGNRDSATTDGKVTEAWRLTLDFPKDWQEQDVNASNIYLLLVATHRLDETSTHYSLVLRWHGRVGRLHCFRRLGIASLYQPHEQNEELTGDWKRKKIHIK